MPDLLLELFSEEIPARMQTRAAADLKKLVTDGLVEAGLTYASAGAFATPRRLCLTVEGLTGESPTVTEERKGPRADAPEKALEGFLRATGLTREDLEIRDDKKGQTWFAQFTRPGRKAEAIIAELIPAVIRNFPWPKSMRWGAGSLRWVRPLHSILCILTDENGASVVPFDVDGIASGDTTRGHRFMGPEAFSVTSFDDYAGKLKRAHVVLSAEDRAATIWNDATNAAFAAGLEVVEDKGLLAEVAGLVEWPVVLMGEIGAEFMELPPEVLQTSMREHQKFFSVKHPKTGRIERFITVANRETADHGATILAGNSKVLTARLSDAKFFWENDLRVAKTNMSRWTQALENVTFHRKLGTQAARIDRIAALARELAPVVGADADEAEQAARIAKADLNSEMVYEFPELQGLMGRYYAQAAGFGEAVAKAAEEHYSPLGPTDDVPTSPVSVAVALADKLDTLTGFWAIDEKPTGSKDPFALRRAALGVIRLVLGNGLRLGITSIVEARALVALGALETVDELKRLAALVRAKTEALNEKGEFGRSLLSVLPKQDVADAKALEQSVNILRGTLEGLSKADSDVRQALEDMFAIKTRLDTIRAKSKDLTDDLLAFLHDRLKVHLRDQNIRHDIIDACLAMPANDDLTLLVKRAEALSAFFATSDGENLVQGYKRAANILAQAEEKDGVEYRFGADAKFAETEEERALFAALERANATVTPALEQDDFSAAMTALADLRAPIDAFFDTVQVNAENEILRRNRLNLLHEITAACGKIADLSRLEG
ncbi:glycine--tRNA ligase subunit beta [Alterinioella nitratireducens]|uniref:glycine--tRNA ligase subunit beta n=1 Tax=Alterinioella nitratireducens TaxID=2735915 RepID=UPI0015517470|nr:glycine--tRNA ligase subunit beta [Alterinioella nitratireducens]NPD19673.1 glycine--tRNA ligase subunit beta [Alterinioella nitratireducens]